MEMSPDVCVSHVSRLLACYPGVRVISAVHHESDFKTFIAMNITSLQSLARIVHTCSVGANLSLLINGVSVLKEYGQPVDESRVQYSIEIPDDNGHGSFADPPGSLHVLGILLARDLKHLGLIDSKYADELQRAWHGVVL